MTLRSTSWKLAVSVLAVAAVVIVISGRFFGPTISPPPDYPDANLRIDVAVTFVGSPQRSYFITYVFIPCPLVDAPAGSPPYCEAKPLNLPAQSDATGTTTIWFRTIRPMKRFAGPGILDVAVTVKHPVSGAMLSEYVRVDRIAHDHFSGNVDFCRKPGSC